MILNSALVGSEIVAPIIPVLQDPGSIASSYWNRYYSEAPEIRQHTMPSDFCVYCVNTVLRRKRTRIADLGCGNGRDSIFLAHNGFRVTAIDLSTAALMLLNENARQTRVTVETHQGDFTRFRSPLPTHAYSRYSLHSIDDEAQRILFQNVRDMVFDKHIFAIEALTTDNIDADAFAHVALWEGDHYRRYLHVPTLIEELKDAGFGIYSAVASKDIAPMHKMETAHVIRIFAS